jgi:hypothetical protein
MLFYKLSSKLVLNQNSAMPVTLFMKIGEKCDCSQTKNIFKVYITGFESKLRK